MALSRPTPLPRYICPPFTPAHDTTLTFPPPSSTESHPPHPLSRQSFQHPLTLIPFFFPFFSFLLFYSPSILFSFYYPYGANLSANHFLLISTQYLNFVLFLIHLPPVSDFSCNSFFFAFSFTPSPSAPSSLHTFSSV